MTSANTSHVGQTTRIINGESCLWPPANGVPTAAQQYPQYGPRQHWNNANIGGVTGKRNLLIVQYSYKADAEQTAACHKVLAWAKNHNSRKQHETWWHRLPSVNLHQTASETTVTTDCLEATRNRQIGVRILPGCSAASGYCYFFFRKANISTNLKSLNFSNHETTSGRISWSHHRILSSLPLQKKN